MKSPGIHRGRKRWKGDIARNLLRFGNQVKASNRQHRCVKHLANRANALGSVGVLVKKRETSGDIQQRRAAQ
jgi:ankyrin repeat protein